MEGKVEFLDHTADRRMVISGKNLEQLFTQGLIGLRQLLRENWQGTPANDTVERCIDVTAPDITSLLVDFLSDVLTYAHIDKAVYSEVDFEVLDEQHVKAKISGYRVDGFDEEVKAVTYHEAEVLKNEKGLWQSTIIFDI